MNYHPVSAGTMITLKFGESIDQMKERNIKALNQKSKSRNFLRFKSSCEQHFLISPKSVLNQIDLKAETQSSPTQFSL